MSRSSTVASTLASRRRFLLLGAGSAAFAAGLPSGESSAQTTIPRTELVMFDATWCGYCRRFKAEVVPGYAATEAGRHFPLRIIDVDREKADFTLKQPVRGTPTFVIVGGGREIARFSGYGGPDHFYGYMNKAVDALRRVRERIGDGEQT